MAIMVLSADEYEAQPFDAVLVREDTVVCVAIDPDDEVSDRDDLVRVFPLSKLNHVDADPGTMLTETELPEWFYGGGEYGFAEVEAFPDLQQHLEEIERETA